MLRSIASKFMKASVSVAGRKLQQTLNEKSRDVEKSQQAVLKDILSYARDTAYGRDHRFAALHTPRLFCEAVPVNTYEMLGPHVLRHASGEPDVLFPGKPMFYATTSGTTDKPKLIPITRKYYEECYKGLTKLWLYTLFRQVSDFMDGRDISMVGKAVEGRTQDGTAYGAFSGQMNADMPEFIKRFRVVPFEVHDIDDYRAKYYTVMRIALAQPIRWIVAANPSTLVELHRVAEEHFDEIVHDIQTGTLNRNLEIPAPIRAAVERRVSPNPKRADVLRAIARDNRRLLPKHYWPGLKLINTWKCGNSGLYLRQTSGFYPETTLIRELGYLATEARAGIPLDEADDTSVLAAHLLFFEFIKEGDIEAPNPRIYLAHELEVGESYYIIITTPSGLYRYNINDIIRVEGFYNEFPKVRFVQKGKGVVSLTGEKLSEAQYLAAIQTAEAALAVQIPFHVAFADIDTSRYHVFVEPSGSDSTIDMEVLAKALDDALAQLNMEYTAKRGSNRLRPLIVHPLPHNAFQRFKQEALMAGARDGQFKLIQLSRNDEQLRIFKHLAGESVSRGAADSNGQTKGN